MGCDKEGTGYSPEIREEMQSRMTQKQFHDEYYNVPEIKPKIPIGFSKDYQKGKEVGRQEIENLLTELKRRQQIIISEPNGIVREQMIEDLFIGLYY